MASNTLVNGTNTASSAADQSTALGYDPIFALSIFGSAIFLVVFLYHLFLYFKLKSRFFWQIMVALLMEATGFILRAYSDHHRDEVRKFLVSYLLLTLAPAIIGIVLLRTFKRLMWYITPPFRRTFWTTWVPDGILLYFFRLAYFMMILIQWVGAGTLIGSFPSPSSSTPGDKQAFARGERMLYISFMIQAGIFVLFLLVGLHFQFVSRNWVPNTLLTPDIAPKSWKRLLATLNISTLLMIARTVYRIFEFNASTPGIRDFLHTHEFTFWAADVAPVLAVFAGLALAHPGHCLTKPYTTFWFITWKLKRREEKVLEKGWSSIAEWQHKGDAEHNAGSDIHVEMQPSVQGLKKPGPVHLPARG